MPCNCDHLEPNHLEKELSRVESLLEEVKTGKQVDPNSSDWRGYKKGVYTGSDLRKRADKATEKLCNILGKKQPAEIKEYSLELQVWWRDHQKSDLAKQNVQSTSTPGGRTSMSKNNACLQLVQYDRSVFADRRDSVWPPGPLSGLRPFELMPYINTNGACIVFLLTDFTWDMEDSQGEQP